MIIRSYIAMFFETNFSPASRFVFLCHSTMYEEKESPPFNGPSNERFLSGKTFLSFLLALLSARETSTRSALVLMYLATTDKRHSATMLKIYGWQGQRVINTTTEHHRRLYRPILSSFLPSSFFDEPVSIQLRSCCVHEGNILRRFLRSFEFTQDEDEGVRISE